MNKEKLIEMLIEEEQKYGLPILLDYVFGKNIKVKLNYSLADCENSIDELSLSVRSQNALKRVNIMTIDLLIDELNNGNLKGIRNLGRKSFNEIQTKVLVYGYEKLSYKKKVCFFKEMIDNNRRP